MSGRWSWSLLAVVALGCGSATNGPSDDSASHADTLTGPRRVVDSFEQKASARVDVLLMIDNSGSMSEEQTKLRAGLPSFLSALTSTSPGVDYHVGVITTDNTNPTDAGRLVNKAALSKPWVGPDTCGVGCDASAKLALNTNVGVTGSGDEKGIYTIMRALTAPFATTGVNQGFLRPDATLAIIALSDEEDSSCGPTLADRGGCGAPLEFGPVDYYARFVRGLKGSGRETFVSFHAIVATAEDVLPTTPALTGCKGEDNASNLAFFAPRYIELARRSGGEAHSICAASLSATLEPIAAEVAGRRTRFALSGVPVTSSLAVFVTPEGGTAQRVPDADFSYRQCRGGAVANELLFAPGKAPAVATRIEARYDLAFAGATCP